MAFSVKLFAIVTVFTVALVTYTVQQENDAAFIKNYDAVTSECAKENGLTPQYANDIWNLQAFPTDNNVKCHLSCLCLKLGVMDENGNIIDDVLEQACAEFYNVTLAEKMGDMCDIAKDGDLCQTAFDAMTCVLNLQNGQKG